MPLVAAGAPVLALARALAAASRWRDDTASDATSASGASCSALEAQVLMEKAQQ